jgi:hypothetical protein
MTMEDTTACGAVGSASLVRSAITCADCGGDAGVLAQGWHAYHVLELDLTKAPALAWFCPDCMELFMDQVHALHARAKDEARPTPRQAPVHERDDGVPQGFGSGGASNCSSSCSAVSAASLSP